MFIINIKGRVIMSETNDTTFPESDEKTINLGDERMFSGPITPLLIRLSVPMLAGMFFQLLYNIVDTWFVSRIDLSDPSYVGGVGLIFPLIFLFIALGNGIMVGVSSLVARAIGEGNKKVLNKTAESGLVISVVLTILCFGVMVLFAAPLVRAIGATGDYYTHGYNYLIFVSPAAIFIFFGNVFIGILQGEGLMKPVMIGMILGTVINIILDPVFIFLLNMDVRGAALATVIGQVASFIYILGVFLKNQSSIRIEWKIKNISKEIIGRIVMIGLPQSMGMVLMAISFFFFNHLVISVDPLALTAFSLFGRFEQLVLMPAFALSAAVVTIVGQNAGRGLYDRAWNAVKKSYEWGIIVVVVLAGSMMLASRFIYPLFSSIPEVVDYAVRQTYTQELFYVFALVGIVNRSFFQAVGHPLPALLLTLLRTILLSLPLSYLFVLVFNMGVEGVWWGLNTGSVLTLLISVPWVKHSVSRLKAGTYHVQSTSKELSD
ncbi:MATE family efflux transporter [Oceanispirochaeta sp. M1]|nr:MATE family efflux transporter [Oceanispirochaeta sp. M1]